MSSRSHKSPSDQNSSTSFTSHHQHTIVAVESSLISAPMAKLTTTRRGHHMSTLRVTGSLTSLSIAIIRNIQSTADRPPPPVMIIPGYHDLSPRNLSLISTDLQFLRDNQHEASRQLAERFLKPLHQIASHLSQLGVIIWCSFPPSCPNYMQKPYPIPHIIHNANAIVHREISKLNSHQKLPHLNVTDGLHTVMTRFLGRSRATRRPACQNASRYLPDGRRFTTKIRSSVFAKICHNICNIHQGIIPQKSRRQVTKIRAKRPATSFRNLPRRRYNPSMQSHDDLST